MKIILNEIRELDESVCIVKRSRNIEEHTALLAGLSVCSAYCAVAKPAEL